MQENLNHQPKTLRKFRGDQVPLLMRQGTNFPPFTGSRAVATQREANSPLKRLQILPRECISPINIFSMSHSDYFNYQFIALNLINHAIFSHTDSMNIHSPNQLRGTDRKRIPCKGFDGLQNLNQIPFRNLA
jgi:hypothetical protein